MELIKQAQVDSGYVGRFGIPYLDDKLSCILANDCILMGARSGAGKTTISTIIAMANSDRKVALFSLENFENDSIIQETYSLYLKMTGQMDLTLRDVLSGKFNDRINWVAMENAEKQAKEKFKHIRLISRKDGYNVDNLKDDMQKAVDDGIELIILDHIDYLDKNDVNTNDVMHISDIMRKIRVLQNNDKCGIVAISHLRKPNTKEPPAVPSIDEFIGSSNKVKESTVVIMLAPDDKGNERIIEDSNIDYLKSTFCCIRKLRNGGYDNKTGIMIFNRKKNNYESDYKERIVSYNGDVKEAKR